jgi:hypothetical protein
MQNVEWQGHLPEKETNGVSSLISVPSDTDMSAHCEAHEGDETKDASKSGLHAPDPAGITMTPIPANPRNDTSSDSCLEETEQQMTAEEAPTRHVLEYAVGTPEHAALVEALKREFPEIYSPIPEFGNSD